MFKLLKIIGENDSAPEIITVVAPYSMTIHAGNVYYLSNGSVTCDRPSEPIRFLALETVPEHQETKLLHGFLITPGMLFEADFEGNINSMYAGEPFTFFRSDNGDIAAICLAAEGDGTSEGIIYSREDVTKTKKLQVLFN